MARPKGATNRPQFHVYTDENDRKEFAAWVKKNYQKDPQLARWYGDQLFGKAIQPLGTEDGKPLMLAFDPTFNASTRSSKKDSQ